jgi:hypothetical protein
MAADVAKKFNVAGDIQKREITKEALDGAKGIDALLSDQTIDAATREKLEEMKENLLKVVRDIETS